MSEQRAIEHEPRYPFLRVTTDAEHADLLSAALFDLGATGVEERDDTTFLKGPGGGNVALVASFDNRADAEAAAQEVEAVEGVLSAVIEEVVGDAWRDAWKEYFEPFELTASIVICPPWKRTESDPSKRTLVLEPGHAFGTGLHATTALVSEVLEERKAALAGKQILDMGCGSGILSIVAMALGAGNVLAVDIDPEVVETVRANAEMNGMGADIDVRAGTVEGVEQTFPWVLANIESRILDPIAVELVARVEKGGYLVLSGILTAEEEAMRARFTSLDRKLVVVSTHHRATGGERAYDKDGWVALLLTDAS